MGDAPLAGRAVWVFVHAVVIVGGASLSGWYLGYRGNGREVYQIWLSLVTLALLHWTWRYVRLLLAVSTAAREYQLPPLDSDDDPDREYRERYERRMAGHDTPD